MGELASFRKQWRAYELAAGLTEKHGKVRAATPKVVMGKECVPTMRRLQLREEEDKVDSDRLLKAFREYFQPQRNVIY